MILNKKTEAKAEALTKKYLLVMINDEAYGIELTRVRELRRYNGVTAIANSPNYVKGVINLRGAIVPIVDMRIRFGDEDPGYDKYTEVVVLELDKPDHEGKTRLAGIVVNAVNDVAKIKLEDVKPAPTVNGMFDSSYLAGLVIHGDSESDMYRLMDIDRLMNSDEMSLVAKDVQEKQKEAQPAAAA